MRQLRDVTVAPMRVGEDPQRKAVVPRRAMKRLRLHVTSAARSLCDGVDTVAEFAPKYTVPQQLDHHRQFVAEIHRR
jgi:hypothetical protein